MTTISERRLGWRQRLHLRCAEHRREGFRRLDGRRDTQHVQVQTPVTEGYLDLVTRTVPSLRLVIYTMLL